METSALHIVAFPYPIRGHVSPLLDLALSLISQSSEIHVTFLQTEANLQKSWPALQRHIDQNQEDCRRLQVLPISDGLPVNRDRDVDYLTFFVAIQKMAPALRRILEDLLPGDGSKPPVSCIISDPNFAWVQDIANEFRLPLFQFITDSATAFAVTLHARKLLRLGFIGAGRRRDAGTVDFIPGVEALPAELLPFPADRFIQAFFDMRLHMYDRIGEAAGVFLNTAYELEKDVIDGLVKLQGSPENQEKAAAVVVDSDVTDTIPMPRQVWTVGPLGFGSGASDEGAVEPVTSSSSKKVMEWLDSQKPGSVIYVCFGSIIVPEESSLQEIAAGLVASGVPFLWSIRAAESANKYILGDLQPRDEPGSHLVVEWAPQRAVLRHAAVGGFLSHCGWNSVMEAISASVPLLCSPFFLDQPLNAHLAVQSWRIGLPLAQPLDRSNIAGLVRHLLAQPPPHLSAARSRLMGALSAHGSSSRNLASFVQVLLTSREQ